jgi:hypothetical protein
MKWRVLTWVVAGLAIVLMGAGPEKSPRVFVRGFKSPPSERREMLMLSERMVKEIERRTLFRCVGSSEEANVVLDGSFTAVAKGKWNLLAVWTVKRTGKVVRIQKPFTPGPAGISEALESLPAFLLHGTTLLR